MYGDDVLRFAQSPVVPWVCDACINSGEAIAATAHLQNLESSYTLPYFAYFDQQKNCATCKEAFVFGKEEQRFWYEELQFPVCAEAKNCPACRKTLRDENAETTELSRLISNLDPENIQQLEAIIAIFVKWENTPKARLYLSFIPKIAGFRTNPELVATHAELKEQIQNITDLKTKTNL
jgi:hypothetical protein